MPDLPPIKADLVGDLGKPIDTFITRFFDSIEKTFGFSIGNLFAPAVSGQQAKAQDIRDLQQANAHARACEMEAESRLNDAFVDAKIEILKERTDLAKQELRREAAERWMFEETRQHQNMKNIIQGALPLLEAPKGESAGEPPRMDDDWVENFFKHARHYSSPDMQLIWSRILAGQANHPGSFSRKTVNLLTDLESRDAEIFAKLCGFVWNFDVPRPLLLRPQPSLKFDAIYVSNQITEASLEHLDSLGLIKYSPVFEKNITSGDSKFLLQYKDVIVQMEMGVHRPLQVGGAEFTQAGQELAGVCRAERIEGFLEYCIDVWSKLDPPIQVYRVNPP